MKINVQKITPFEADGIVYQADTCLPLIDAVKRRKLKFKALARYTYPGDRLTDDTLGLNSVGYWDANEPQDWGLDWHRNEGIEIHFLESGTMPYAQQNEEMDLLPNYLTITRPWEAHKVGSPSIGMGKFYWVILDLDVRRPHQNWVWPEWIMLAPSDLEKLTMILRHNERILWKADKRIRDCFQRIGKAVDTDVEGNNASRIRLLINYLLILLLDLLIEDEVELNEQLTDSSRSVKLFLSELDNNLSEAWTIEDMAKSAGVGITRFTYHCKQLTNLTPMRYLMIKRLKMSKDILIENEKMSVAEVAFTCGFSTSQYFSTVFKKHEKCTPIEYRLKHSVLV
ncbi:AraC family transcriptional regulator, L-rhamnose operon regulatory protein RhaS [Flaviramulus basaltis]|uniref:AraC family transcriptional regulator, L-rhamnose operon regulatory protein RhaS n=1 Tax=Flaviramulus basaltis TaxID=369401 RepID=A0A1K2IEQ6_9FLAO|nr:AraC family transcriptional regulator [Flaviramulus basaltis]SFZ90924.1 AraC family transcriptional regulator, L-rhamnose operon regulatory protein RhaS [Flaviramulus basaltis]